MNIKLIFILLIFTFVSGCSSKVAKEKEFSLRDEVDLENLNPLSEFIEKKDSLHLFDSFSKYVSKDSHREEKDEIEKTQSYIYYVQVGLTDSYEEINSLRTKLVPLLENEKLEIIYEPPFYRILIGPFKSKNHANEIFSILERKNFSSIRIRTELSK